MEKNMDLKGKVAVITGGASGLGKATAEKFIAGGAKVAIFDMNVAEGNVVAEQLGSNAIFCSVDVTDEESIISAVESVIASFGAIHICVNCAGRGGGATKTLGRAGRFPMELFKNVIDINLIGTFNVLTQCSEKMALNDSDEKGERGVIINTASIAAFDGQRGQVAYAASKAALAGITLPIARDLAYYGIRIITIAPGLFETPLLKNMTPEIKKDLAKDIQFPARLGVAEEYSKLALHIVDNTYLNGETIRLDGGLRLGVN
jgi:NAD(P)-dependent dehydrogenase (short-subunit alcohol dehydrogenase family)